MIIFEAEDFELYYGGRSVGRYMVNSIEPYEVDIKKEYKKHNNDVYEMRDALLESGIIVEYKPNFTVEVSLFDDRVDITDNRDWKDETK